MPTRSRFGKQDDVMLDREIDKIRKSISRLTEWHATLSKDLWINIDKILSKIEKIEQRLNEINRNT